MKASKGKGAANGHAKPAPRQAKRIAQNRESKRGTNPKSLANLEAHKFTKGVSGNPGGRPKSMSDAYKEWLALVDENDPQRRTNAQIGAASIGAEMLKGDVGAAKEIRSSTEGDKLTLATWQTEIVEALKAGRLTAQQVIDELGIEDARPILVASGAAFLQGASAIADDPSGA